MSEGRRERGRGDLGGGGRKKGAGVCVWRVGSGGSVRAEGSDWNGEVGLASGGMRGKLRWRVGWSRMGRRVVKVYV